MQASRSKSEAPVSGLTARAFEVPTDRPESDGTLEWKATTIVVAEAEAGGERGLGYTYAPAVAAEVVRTLLAPMVAGADALAPPATFAQMRAGVRNAGQQGLCAMAISAVDLCLWDLRAKLLGLSLADALGRCRETIPGYGSGGFTSYDDETLATQLGGWAEAGFERVKIKVGREPECDPHRIEVARAAIGPGVALMVDANGAFERRAAARWAARYAELGAVYLEEPVPSADLEGLRWLRDVVPTGLEIAAGEYLWELAEMERLAPCVDILQADVTRCGGPTALLRADGICRAHRVPFSAHCAPQASAHLCCALESAVHLEYFHDHSRVESLLFDGAVVPEAGLLRPDRSRPGLGIELREADAERFRT
ncbi:MAG TPA: enolase C-terminal domain-like protein [Solirubrobacterales bacterium]